jgi:hypothetical protein
MSSSSAAAPGVLLTKKSINVLGSKISEARGSQVSSFAQNYMKKLGWSEGKGLGKSEDGMQTHIKVSKKEEATGLGLDKAVVEQTEASEHWWHDAFSSTLKSFTASTNSSSKKRKRDKKEKKNKKDRNDDEDDDDDDDASSKNAPSFEDLFKATGGARLGMRARASQNGKIKRTEHLEDVKQLSLRGESTSVAAGSESLSDTTTTADSVDAEDAVEGDVDVDAEADQSSVSSRKSKKEKKERKEKKEKKAKKDRNSE